ncbi:hypothetical protein F5X96DRAFT_680760 [Biscogniauxia mediterranea]|nr:hypothetical protein F5X96DRAFT_680760 [Biscogniauxia mediterranea]
MRDEVENARNRAWQQDMPFLSTPTQPAHSYRADSGKEPVITSSTELGTTEFALGIDTCGFTFGSTITCEFGYECTNVGTYRGCCVPGASDCSSTIHTSCIDYGLVDNSAQCGPHTLCCPWTAASCFSYAFTTDTEPDATFTYVQCQQSRGFGEMYPQPPEFTTDTPPETASESSESPTSLTVQPEDNQSSGSTPAGAIAGAVCGALAFLCLAIVAAYMLMRRRKQKRQQVSMATISTEPARLKDETPEATSPDGGAAFGAGSFRPLSTVHEQGSPTGSPSREKRKSAFPRVRSLDPNWPLGANGNPLASHPVDLEKRSSRNTSGGDQPGTLRPLSQQIQRGPEQQGVPILQVPTPPSGSRLAPPPPPPKSPRASSSSSPRTPTSTGGMLQSPRLSFVPVSPIEAAFDAEMDRRQTWFDDSPETPVSATSGAAGNSSTRGSYGGSGLTAPRALTPVPPMLSLQGLNNTSATDFAAVDSAAADREPVSPVSPVSPLDGDDDGDGIDMKRLSFVSVPSAPGEGDREMDELVSPISPNHPGSADGRATPETVSPLESRQGSLRGR